MRFLFSYPIIAIHFVFFMSLCSSSIAQAPSIELKINGGVAADGPAWLGLNYGRLARLRLVTGYPGALDWSKDEIAPENDGLFIVDIKTGDKRLLVSYRQLEDKLKESKPHMGQSGLFINHTLWNRDANRVYFFVRRCYLSTWN